MNTGKFRPFVMLKEITKYKQDKLKVTSQTGIVCLKTFNCQSQFEFSLKHIYIKFNLRL